jgi:hypothetical protein
MRTATALLAGLLAIGAEGCQSAAQHAARLVPGKELLAELSNVPQSDSQRARRLIALFMQAGLRDIGKQPIAGYDGRYNVIATLPGESLDTIVVGAHYDFSLPGQGVIDNWSGATMLANLAQALSAQPRRSTFVFVGFDLEEWGMLGSQYYVAQLAPQQRQRIRAMVNMDCLGVSCLKIWLTGSARDLVAIGTEVARQESIKVQTRELRGVGADSDSFMRAGIPAIMFDSLEMEDFSLVQCGRDQYEAVRPKSFVEHHRYLLAFLRALDTHQGRISPTRTPSTGPAPTPPQQYG